MNTTPENVPDETLIQAKVVHVQLLIKTNTPDIVREILDIYMVRMEIRTMQAGEFKLISTIRYGGPLYRTNFGNFWISLRPTGDIIDKVKATNRYGYRDLVSSDC